MSETEREREREREERISRRFSARKRTEKKKKDENEEREGGGKEKGMEVRKEDVEEGLEGEEKYVMEKRTFKNESCWNTIIQDEFPSVHKSTEKFRNQLN